MPGCGAESSYWTRLIGSALLISFSGGFHVGIQATFFHDVESIRSGKLGFEDVAFQFGAIIGLLLFASCHDKIRLTIGSASGAVFLLLFSVLLLIPNCIEYGIFFIGIGVGACLGFQVLFINDVALPSYRAQLALITPLTVSVGSIIGHTFRQTFDIQQHRDRLYGAYAIAQVPVAATLLSVLFWIWEPPLTYFVRADETRAVDSAEYYHPPKSADEATMDAMARLRAKPQVNTLLSIWSDTAGQAALFSTVCVNIAAGYAGEKLTIQSRELSRSNQADGLESLWFILLELSALAAIGLLFVVVDRIERKVILLASFGAMCVLELLHCAEAILFEQLQYADSASFLIKLVLLVAYQMAFAFGVGSLSWFAACDVAFAGTNAVVLAISLSSRFAAEAWSVCLCKPMLGIPWVVACSGTLVVIFIASGLGVYAAYPLVLDEEAHDVLKQLGYSSELDYTKDEVSEFQLHRQRLWDSCVKSNSQSKSQ